MKDRTRLKPFTVVEWWLRKYRTTNGAWTRFQLEAIGVTWPPERGWFKRVIGMQISPENRHRFESGRTVTAKTETRVRF